MKAIRSKRLPLVAALLALPNALTFTTPLAAQPTGADKVLEEIMVTARRREEGLQDAPIAISAFTGDTLAYRGVTQLDQVEKFVPNLTVQNNPSFGGASNSAAIYIRGVGQKEFLPTTEPGVGLYVDGVYIARSVGAVLDLIDVERLEVLRGPQGTLFGRNTIGGALSITTVKPAIGAGFGGEVAAAVGTDNRLNVKGALDIPVGSTMGLRVSAATFQQDGYVERRDGEDLGDDDTTTARLAWAWEPNPRLRTDLSMDYTRDRENGPALELIAIDFTDLSQLQGELEGPAAGELDSIVAECDALLASFNAVLRISTLESGSQLVGGSEVDIGQLLQDVVELYEPLAHERELSLTLDSTAVLHCQGEAAPS